MYNVSEISNEKLQKIFEKFIDVTDWSVDLLPVLLFASQRNSSMETIYDRLRKGKLPNIENIKGEKLIIDILPLLFVPLDFGLDNHQNLNFSLENLLDCSSNSENLEYLMSFVSEAKQIFPVYDHEKHIKASTNFHSTINKILVSSLFPINFNFDSNIGQASLFLFHSIAKELEKRKFADIDDLFWNPLLDKYSLISEEAYKNITLPVVKVRKSGSLIFILDNVDLEIAKEFTMLDGCITKYIETSNRSLRKRDDTDRKKITSRVVVSVYDPSAMLQSSKEYKKLISKTCEKTLKELLKHLQSE